MGAVYGPNVPPSQTSYRSSTPTLAGTGGGSSGSGSATALPKPPGLGGWASVAGNDDEIQRVATGDRKAIDRLRSGAGLGSASGSAGASGSASGSGSGSTPATKTSGQDAYTLMQWCASAHKPMSPWPMSPWPVPTRSLSVYTHAHTPSVCSCAAAVPPASADSNSVASHMGVCGQTVLT